MRFFFWLGLRISAPLCVVLVISVGSLQQLVWDTTRVAAAVQGFEPDRPGSVGLSLTTPQRPKPRRTEVRDTTAALDLLSAFGTVYSSSASCWSQDTGRAEEESQRSRKQARLSTTHQQRFHGKQRRQGHPRRVRRRASPTHSGRVNPAGSTGLPNHRPRS
jgi:hypothetical protein